MDRPVIKGETVEEKLDSVEAHLRQMRGSLGTKIFGFIPPVPIFAYCSKPPENGILTKILVPYSCDVGNVFIRVGKYNKKSAVFIVSFGTDIAESSMRVELKAPVHIYKPVWHFDAGTILTLAVSDPLAVEEIIVGMETFPDIEKGKQEVFVQKQLIEIKESEEPSAKKKIAKGKINARV